jgi:hypothetical protein
LARHFLAVVLVRDVAARLVVEGVVASRIRGKSRGTAGRAVNGECMHASAHAHTQDVFDAGAVRSHRRIAG